MKQTSRAVQGFHQIKHHLRPDSAQFALNPRQVEAAGQAHGFVAQLAQGIGNRIGLGDDILFVRRAVGRHGIMHHGDTHDPGSFPGLRCGECA